jgi:hypothetical protein
MVRMATISKDACKVQPQKLNDLRRSQRVLLRLPVQVSGEAADRQPFSEGTTTLIVNAHGALVLLAAKVSVGQTLTVTNVTTGEKLPCHVANIGPANSGKAEIGVGFNEPAPFFWRIAFPPPDWTPRASS